MIRLDGNAILLADSDPGFLNPLADELSRHGARCFIAADMGQARELLSKFDFDLVISNYYLSDGIIYQLMDWCTNNLSFLPIFTCVGHPFGADEGISQKQAIVNVFHKHETRQILSGVSRLLFSFSDFHENLLEMIDPSEIKIEICVSEYNFLVSPLEINEDNVYLAMDREFSKGTFGVLKFAVVLEERYHSFIIPGSLDEKCQSGQVFVVDDKYRGHWKHFLNYLNMKQVKITKFLSKAAGF
jgi:hypothetical protein